MLKAIETSYRGYRFRSRLEARWAVFFDAIGIVWDYENEGFELGEGERYLPDFHLAHFEREDGMYVEIKPEGSRGVDFRKAILFANRQHIPVLMAIGAPGAGPFVLCDGHSSLRAWFDSKYLPGGRNGSELRLYTDALDQDGPSPDRFPWSAIHAARGARFDSVNLER